MELDATDIFVLGSGGHARVLLDLLSLAHPEWRVAILELDRSLHGSTVMGVEVVGGDELMQEIARINLCARFTVGVGTVRDSGPRRRLFQRGLASGLPPQTLIHPSAVASRFASVGLGAQLLSSCVVNTGAVIGMNVVVNSGAVVEHDCVVKGHAHIASGACIAAEVTVGAGAHVGAGASVRQGLNIGDGAVVGVGAAVVRDVLPGDVVIGVPARPYSEWT